MPKFPTFPTLYDEVLTVYMHKLREWGYLKPGQVKHGVMKWSRNGTQTASISISVNTLSAKPYLELNYKNQGKPIVYKVELVSVPSNLGKGLVWYFLCPTTLKRCRNLYLVGEKFLHREAFNGCLYEKQTQSHRTRELLKLFKIAFESDKIYEEIYKKQFKTFYAGKPTKRYVKLMNQLKQIEKINPDQFKKFW